MTEVSLDAIDRAIIRATQEGLPLVPDPYQEIADRLGLESADVIARLKGMLERGVIRRIGVVPNHYALGLTQNAMTVWDVADEKASDLGRQIGALDFVTHCYLRPRHRPIWPYNLFAMVHGRSESEIEEKIVAIREQLAPDCRGHDALVSVRILKKSGLRLAA